MNLLKKVNWDIMKSNKLYTLGKISVTQSHTCWR